MNHITTATTHQSRKPSFKFRHVVGFEETNVVGNVYFSRHVSWQGKCREMFLKEHAPSVLEDLRGDFRLITLRCSCEYFAELQPFDEVEISMRLDGLVQNRISLAFEYRRTAPGDPVIVAAGAQDLSCMRLVGDRLTTTDLPHALRSALLPFGDPIAVV